MRATGRQGRDGAEEGGGGPCRANTQETDQRLWPPVSSSLRDKRAEAALVHEPRRPTVCGLRRGIYYFSAWPTSSQD